MKFANINTLAAIISFSFFRMINGKELYLEMVKTVCQKSILGFLKQNYIMNMNIIGIMTNVPQAEIYVDNETAPKVVVVRNGYMNHIYFKEEAVLDDVCRELFHKTAFYGFSGVQCHLAEKIKQRYSVNWEGHCRLYCLLTKDVQNEQIKNKVQPIDIKDAETIDQYYTFRNERSLDKIKKDILERPSSAIYVDGEIVAWMLVHEDDSMGVLYTKEGHRRKGYASDIVLDLAGKRLQGGKVPFLHMREENTKAHGLPEKCGFVQCGYGEWFGIVVGAPTGTFVR